MIMQAASEKQKHEDKETENKQMQG